MLGSGARYNFSPKYSMSLGPAYMHVSELYMSEPKLLDNGINVWGGMVGFNMRTGRLSSTDLRLGCRSSPRGGTLPHFDLPVPYADVEDWLWVDRGTVNNMAVFQRKPGSVIGAFNAVVHQLAF